MRLLMLPMLRPPVQADVDPPAYVELPRCGYTVTTPESGEHLCLARVTTSGFDDEPTTLVFFSAGEDGLPPEGYRQFGHYSAGLLVFRPDAKDACPTGTRDDSAAGSPSNLPPAQAGAAAAYHEIKSRVVAEETYECSDHVLVGGNILDVVRSIRVEPGGASEPTLRNMGTFLKMWDGSRVPAEADHGGAPLVRAEKLEIRGLEQFPANDFYLYKQAIVADMKCWGSEGSADSTEHLVGATVPLKSGADQEIKLNNCDSVGLLVTGHGQSVYDATSLWSGGWLPAAQAERNVRLEVVADVGGKPMARLASAAQPTPLASDVAPLPPPVPPDATTVTLAQAPPENTPTSGVSAAMVCVLVVPILGLGALLAALLGLRLTRR